MAVLPDDLNKRLELALGNASVAEYLVNLLAAMPEFRVIDEVVTLTNAVETNLSVVVPAGAVITSVQAKLNTTVAGDASGDDLGDKIGIGITATPSKYGATASLVQNQEVNWVPTFTRLASDEQICVKLIKADGSTAATEKFVAGGKVRVRVGYMRLVASLPSK